MLGGGVRAVIASTTMIVIFGEVIPQAVSQSPLDQLHGVFANDRSVFDTVWRLVQLVRL